MINNDIFQWLAAAIGALIGWFVKLIHDELKEHRQSIKELTERHAAIEILVAGDYVKKTDFEKKIDVFFAKLDRIEELLHNKEDRKH